MRVSFCCNLPSNSTFIFPFLQSAWIFIPGISGYEAETYDKVVTNKCHLSIYSDHQFAGLLQEVTDTPGIKVWNRSSLMKNAHTRKLHSTVFCFTL